MKKKIVVNDANILFDLIDLDLIDVFFKLDYSFHITDLVLDEIKIEGQKFIVGDYILKNKLYIIGIKDITRLYTEQRKNPKLSIEDCSVLIAAKDLGGTVLTGDNLLRKTSENHGLEVHGILWVFDNLVHENIISHSDAYIKLEKLMTFNKRLPENECKHRLTKWSDNSY